MTTDQSSNPWVEVGPLSWDELTARFGVLKKGTWLFRGQADARWDLKTSIQRYTPPGWKVSAAERELLNEFKRRAHTFLEPHLVPTETSEWLALMQHFGAPTRLLDATSSPYVATYFAVEEIPHGAECCAVWAFDRFWCSSAAGALRVTGSPEEQEKKAERIAELLEVEPSETLLQDMVGFRLEKSPAEDWFKTQTPMVLPFAPSRLSERMSVQQGHFLLPLNVDMSFVDNLRALGDPDGRVVKILIDAESRGRILEQLRFVNITRASLFPGLEGYAQSLRTLLVGESDTQRNRRLPPWGPLSNFRLWS